MFKFRFVFTKMMESIPETIDIGCGQMTGFGQGNISKYEINKVPCITKSGVKKVERQVESENHDPVYQSKDIRIFQTL